MIGLTHMEWKNTMRSKDEKAAPIIWPSVGSVCLGRIHFTLEEVDLPSLNTFQIKESYNIDMIGLTLMEWENTMRSKDVKAAPFIEDIMELRTEKEVNKSWDVPPSFKSPRYRLLRNRILSERQISSQKWRHFLSSIEKLFENSLTETAYLHPAAWKRSMLVSTCFWCIPPLKKPKTFRYSLIPASSTTGYLSTAW